MRGKRTDLPTSYDGMTDHLMGAWQRLKEGRPENPRLAELAKKGRLKVNVSSVAEEAGVSRTLIGFEGCRYPSVRKAILGEEDLPVRVKSDMRSINSDLREMNRILEERLKLALSEQAAILNRMQKMEEEYDDKLSEFRRISARASQDPYEIVGLRVVAKGKKGMP